MGARILRFIHNSTVLAQTTGKLNMCLKDPAYICNLVREKL